MQQAVRNVSIAAALGAAIAGCAAAQVDAGAAGGGQGPATSGGHSGSTYVPTFGDAGAPPDGGHITLIGPAALPPAWKYYDEPKDHAFKDALLPANARDQFAGQPFSMKPVWVYPLEGAMHPANLAQLTLQWRRGLYDAVVFRIDAAVDDQTYRFFTTCKNGSAQGDNQCAYTLPESDWLNLLGNARGKPVKLTINETNGKGGPVATSDPLTVHVSPGALNGGLYYWSAALKSLKRVTFGAPQSVAYITPSSPTNDFECAGCHSVSRDGKVVAFGVDSEPSLYPQGIRIAPTDAPDQPYVRPAQTTVSGKLQPTSALGSNVALNPDGTLALVNNKWALELWDARTGAQLWTLPAGSGALGGGYYQAILPEWSPDGRHVVAVFTRKTDGSWDFYTDNGTIGLFDYDPAAKQLTNARVLVKDTWATDKAYHYYPTWSPDGKWIAFVSGNAGSSKDNRNGVLRLVPVDGGPHACPSPTCVDLVNGQQYATATALQMHAARGSTWPKFTPFAQRAPGATSDDVMFISFTSRLDYGFLAYAQTQMWMFAVDVSRARAGQDPSYPPIWLPYQSFKEESLTPYWTEKLVCDVKPDGSCAGCVNGEACGMTDDGACVCVARPPG